VSTARRCFACSLFGTRLIIKLPKKASDVIEKKNRNKKGGSRISELN
jgi:hypothetical protein